MLQCSASKTAPFQILQLTSMSATPSPPPPLTVDPSSLETLTQSILLILFSEIGDKTFLISALLAMRHPRLTVFSGAIASLLVMSALSASLGHILPSLIPRKWTQFAAAVLFLIFGLKMAAEARKMKGDAGNEKMREEMREAEEEIAEDDGESVPMQVLEEGRGDEAPPSKTPKRPSWMEGARNFSSLIFGPVFVQAFVLTFLGEWGDRSQIATIALGAAHVCCLTILSLPCFSFSFKRTECLSRYSRNDPWSLLLHCAGCHWRALRFDENLCKTWYVTVDFRSDAFVYDSCFPLVTWGGSVLFLIFSVLYFYEACVEWGEVEVPLPLDVNTM